MPILIYISWICYALAALCLAAILSTESLTFLVPAIAAAVSGVLFAALERIIDTLTDIRDAVVQGSKPKAEKPNHPPNPPPSAPEVKKLNLETLDEKIDRFKKNR